MIPNEELWERTGHEQIIQKQREGSGDGLAILFGSLQQIQRDRHLAGTLKEGGKWEGQGKRGERVWKKS